MRSPISQRSLRNLDKAYMAYFNANYTPFKMKKQPAKRAPGGGRKQKYNEVAKRVTFRCPESRIPEFRKAVNAILKSYVKEQKPD